MSNRKTWNFGAGRKIEVGKTYTLTAEHDTRTLTVKSIWSDKYTNMMDVVDDKGNVGEWYPNSAYYQVDWSVPAF